MLLIVYTASFADNSYKNNLMGYLKQHGSKIVDFSVNKRNELRFDSVLCISQKRCIGGKLGIDSGDPFNNITLTTSELLNFNAKTNKLLNTYIDSHTAGKLPFSVSKDTFRYNYLGNVFLAKNDIWIDFGNKKIYLNASENMFNGFMENTNITYKKIKLERDRGRFKNGNYVSIYLSVNGNTPVKFIIDNGASNSLIDYDYAKSVGIQFNKNNCFSSSNSQVGNLTLCRTYDVYSVRWRGNELGNYLANGFLAPQNFFNHFPQKEKVKGILGMDWLLTNQAILSVKNKVLYLPYLSQRKNHE